MHRFLGALFVAALAVACSSSAPVGATALSDEETRWCADNAHDVAAAGRALGFEVPGDVRLAGLDTTAGSSKALGVDPDSIWRAVADLPTGKYPPTIAENWRTQTPDLFAQACAEAFAKIN